MVGNMASIVAGAFVLAVAAGAAFAGDVNQDAGVAVKGYDPVAYFVDHKPVKGSPAYTAEFGGVTYEFASKAHRDAFSADPAKYVPQYGGFCAFAMAKGHKADIDPAAFSIVANKLYLNHSEKVRDMWQQDIPDFVTQADNNWSSVAQQPDDAR